MVDIMTIETYAERLQKKKERKTMSNYDMYEIVRQRDREKKSKGIILEDEIEAAVTIELPDKDLLKLALAAHERNITLNKLCGIVIKDSLKSLDYKFEHETKPQLLKEY